MALVKVNTRYVLGVCNGPVMREAKKRMEKIVKTRVMKANAKLLADFLKNDITQEIAAGPTASNISGTLGGKGNLFSFLGFESSSSPIVELIEFLTNCIRVEAISVARNSYSIKVRISMPTVEDMESFTELPWTNRSWIRAIEGGISGLGAFLYSEHGFDTSRSATGIQANREFSTASLKPQKYLTDILKSISKKLVSDIKASVS